MSDNTPSTRPLSNNSHIAAIPTSYHDVMFRSRLEARWAVFFDALHLEWQYEPRKLTLINGIRYIPDFLLSNIGQSPSENKRSEKSAGYWIEIKPELSFYSDPKAKGMNMTRQLHNVPGGGNTMPNYYLADSHFRFYHVRYAHSKYEQREVWFVEMLLMRTKSGFVTLNRDARTYGSRMDIDNAVRQAQGFHF